MKVVLKLAWPREVSWNGFMGVSSSFVTIQRTYMFVFKYILSITALQTRSSLNPDNLMSS